MKIIQDRSSESRPSRKATILVVGPIPPPYHGVSVITKIVLDSKIREKYHLVHLDTTDRRDLANIGRIDFQNTWLAIKHIVNLIGMLYKQKPDIVYIPICQSIKGLLRDTFFILLSKRRKSQVIIHLHGGYFRKLYQKTNVIGRFIIRKSCQIVSKALVLGNCLRYIFEDLVAPERVKVVSCGIGSDYITDKEFERAKHLRMSHRSMQKTTLPAVQQPLRDKSANKLQVLFLSNLILSKGFYDVIKAVPEVVRHYKDARFIFAGEFLSSRSKKQEITKFIESKNLKPYITFAGRVSGNVKKDLLLNSDLFVLPTYYDNEGQPMAILEAMAAGLPVISTDQGTIREMVINDENGYIVDKQNQKQLAEKIIQLLDNKELRLSMGSKARERFLSCYTIDTFVNNLDEVLNEEYSKYFELQKPEPQYVAKPKTEILIIGPTPPPYMGPSVATKMILESELKEKVRVLHLDTSDRRSISNIGILDISNVYLAFFQVIKLFYIILRYAPKVTYLPICQTIVGYLRDTAFILLSKVVGASVVIHLRGGYFRKLYEKSNPLARLIIRSTLRFVDRVIVLGDSLRYIFEGLVPSEKITVVPNGIDENYISGQEIEARERLHSEQPERRNRILFLSNLILSKGFYDIIKSIPRILEYDRNVDFIFAGDDCETSEVKKIISKFITDHELNQFVKFPGLVREQKKKELLLSSDIFVFPTYYHAEGQPWVIIEAMAAGLPIISTDQGCIKEMVVNDENGFVIEKQNPSQIAQKIIYLLKNDRIKRRMGQKSRERFLQHYTKNIFINRLASVLNDTIIK